MAGFKVNLLHHQFVTNVSEPLKRQDFLTALPLVIFLLLLLLLSLLVQLLLV